MQLACTMIGATGDYTFSGLVQRDADGRFYAEAWVFDHPDPSVSLPSGTTPRHLQTVEGASLEDAKLLLEQALAARLGALDWVRWHPAEGRGGGAEVIWCELELHAPPAQVSGYLRYRSEDRRRST